MKHWNDIDMLRKLAVTVTRLWPWYLRPVSTVTRPLRYPVWKVLGLPRATFQRWSPEQIARARTIAEIFNELYGKEALPVLVALGSPRPLTMLARILANKRISLFSKFYGLVTLPRVILESAFSGPYYHPLANMIVLTEPVSEVLPHELGHSVQTLMSRSPLFEIFKRQGPYTVASEAQASRIGEASVRKALSKKELELVRQIMQRGLLTYNPRAKLSETFLPKSPAKYVENLRRRLEQRRRIIEEASILSRLLGLPALRPKKKKPKRKAADSSGNSNNKTAPYSLKQEFELSPKDVYTAVYGKKFPEILEKAKAYNQQLHQQVRSYFRFLRKLEELVPVSEKLLVSSPEPLLPDYSKINEKIMHYFIPTGPFWMFRPSPEALPPTVFGVARPEESEIALSPRYLKLSPRERLQVLGHEHMHILTDLGNPYYRAEFIESFTPLVEKAFKTSKGYNEYKFLGTKKWDYLAEPAEFTARLAGLKRLYYLATGKVVNSPEEAKEAWRYLYRNRHRYISIPFNIRPIFNEFLFIDPDNPDPDVQNLIRIGIHVMPALVRARELRFALTTSA